MIEPLLEITGLSKYFGGTAALDDVGIEIAEGEILGLVGQNGSGKSTLIKCLSGYHAPDSSWTLTVGGRTLRRALRPGEVGGLGMAFVHQDLALISDLTVLENLLITRFAEEGARRVSWRAERRRARELFDLFGLALDPRATLSTLRPVEQAQVAIIRAVMQLRSGQAGAGVLVLDEATTFLDRAGRASLHDLLRAIARSGAGVLFVSHDVREVLSLADRVTVLRDGRVVETAPASSLQPEEMVGLIVGGDRSLRLSSPAAEELASPREVTVAPPARRVSRVTVGGLSGPAVSDVCLTARAGEVTGITGIVGAGWESLLDHLYGSRPAAAGVLEIDGVRLPLSAMSPARAIGLGMVLVPSDRLAQGIIADLAIKDNVMLPVLDKAWSRGRLHVGQLTRQCEQVLRDHGVVPPLPDRAIGTLSGGNQQKAVIGKWLQLAPPIVLLNEPTQGVDVGARQLIFGLIKSAVKQGSVVLYASGDWDEVSALADRVIVVADGHIAATLVGADASVERIAEASYRWTRSGSEPASATDLLASLTRAER